MESIKIMLSSINEVKDFVDIVSKFNFEIDLISGRYVIDAKSIMAIFSLDLSKPIEVIPHTDNLDLFHELINKFII